MLGKNFGMGVFVFDLPRKFFKALLQVVFMNHHEFFDCWCPNKVPFIFDVFLEYIIFFLKMLNFKNSKFVKFLSV